MVLIKITSFFTNLINKHVMIVSGICFSILYSLHLYIPALTCLLSQTSIFNFFSLKNNVHEKKIVFNKLIRFYIIDPLKKWVKLCIFVIFNSFFKRFFFINTYTPFKFYINTDIFIKRNANLLNSPKSTKFT